MRTSSSKTCTISGRLRCRVSMISMRASSRSFCFSRPRISWICLSSSVISSLMIWLRSFWCSIAALICQRPSRITSAAVANAAPIDRKNSWRLRLRSASRHGSRLILGMSVEAPQRQTAGSEQRGRVLLHALRQRAGRDLHLPERVAALRRDADAARDHVRDARDVGAAAADQDLLGLLAARARGEVELQRAAHLLAHVVDEGVEHLGLVVGRQPAFLLGAPGLLEAEP